jgi:hypothetical protein
LRQLREQHIAGARERIFGPQGNLPGDRYLRKKLEGRQLMKWYFPSKFGLQDFRVDEYFEMQAERHAPRTPHRCMTALNSTAQEVAKHREELRRFFKDMDEATFLNTPTLQDLYGVFRMVDPDPVLSFPVPENIFLEHSPLWGASPPFRYPSQSLDVSHATQQPQAEDPAEESAGAASTASSQEAIPTIASSPEEMPEELLALWALVSEGLTEKGGSTLANALDSRINMVQSEEEVRKLLLEEAQQLGIVAPFEDSSVIVEDGRLAAYLVRAESGGSKQDRAYAQEKAEEELIKMKTTGSKKVREFLTRRHRFVDPMFRRRRWKWLERQMAGKNKEREVKYNTYYATHPDKHEEWPTNKGSVTVVWPSPYH